MNNIDKSKVSICFHASDKDVADKQLSVISEDLRHVKDCTIRYRSERHPGAYPSFSELVNTAINESVHENIVLVNDKVMPRKGDILRMLDLLSAGFGYVGLYSVGFCALTKGLIGKIGWFDERYLGGGYEDDDFLLRMKLHDISIFDSHESNYDYAVTKTKQSVKVPLSRSEPHFNSKWKFYDDKVERVLPEEQYDKYDLGTTTTSQWLSWRSSVIGYYYGVGPKKGIPEGSHVLHHHGQTRAFRFCTVPHAGHIVGHDRIVINASK